MIQRLKYKLIATIMCILSLVFLAIVGGINIVSYQSNHNRVMGFLHTMADNNGQKPKFSPFRSDNRPPKVIAEEIFGLSTFYSAKLDNDGNIIRIINDYQDLYSDEEIAQLTEKALAQGKKTGAIDHQVYLIKEKPHGKLIVFADNRFADDAATRLLLSSVVLTLIGLMILFSISLLLANWLVKPVEQAFQRQKQFISDASHELKTPLSVILANADVLENEIGENKWLGYIRSEAGRMNILVAELLTLAQLESQTVKPVFADFDFSKATTGIALPFESTAFETDRKFRMNIQPDIYYTGNEERLKQLTAILIDNAFKYSHPQGEIIISLRQIPGKCILEVFNTGEEIPPEEQEKIFERFYRIDQARTRSQASSGLGLAIAKAIVEEHHGKIMVESENGWVKFTVIL